MTINKKPAAFERDGLFKLVLLGSTEPQKDIPTPGQIQQRARDLFLEALGLRGADRHAALSLSRHYGQAGRRAA